VRLVSSAAAGYGYPGVKNLELSGLQLAHGSIELDAPLAQANHPIKALQQIRAMQA
jgi:hypothetical protein